MVCVFIVSCCATFLQYMIVHQDPVDGSTVRVAHLHFLHLLLQIMSTFLENIKPSYLCG